MQEIQSDIPEGQYNESTLTVTNARFTYIMNRKLYRELTADGSASNITVPHSHLYYELLFVRSGHLILRCSRGEVSIKSGQYALISPTMQHVSDFSTEDSTFYSLGFTVSCTDSADGIYETLRSVLNFEGICRLTADRYFLCSIDALHRAWADSSLLPSMQATSIAHSIVLSVLDQLHKQGMHGACRHRLNAAACPEHLLEKAFAVDKYLNNNFTRAVTEESVSRMFYIGKRQLNELIRLMYGQTFRQRITSLRLSHAAYLLKSTDRSVEEIIHEVGYISVGNFNQLFRQTYGINPGAYRRNFRVPTA